MLKTLEALKPRDIYLNRLIAFQDTEPVKVIRIAYQVFIFKTENPWL